MDATYKSTFNTTYKKTPVVYLLISILCLIIFVIYSKFSHGVSSPFMTYLFGWPLLLGLTPAMLYVIFPKLRRPDRVSFNIYNSGVAALTVSSLLKGIFDIAGNNSRYQIYLMITGFVFLGAGLLIYFFRNYIRRTDSSLE